MRRSLHAAPGKARPLAKPPGPRNATRSVPLWSSGKQTIYHWGPASVVAPMVAIIVLAFFAATGSGDTTRAPVHMSTKAVAPAQATVRILSGAKIRLGAERQPEGYRMKPAVVTVEDGSRRSAQLVEFQ